MVCVLAWLKYQRGQGLEELVDFTDSDLAGDIDDRKSTTGKAFHLNENLSLGNLRSNELWHYLPMRSSSCQQLRRHAKYCS